MYSQQNLPAFDAGSEDAHFQGRYHEIRRAAEQAAGPRGKLRWRAQGYLDVYNASNGVCRFALIAAHGALWASWYLVCAKLAAAVFAASDPTTAIPIRERYRQFSAYIEALKDINRLVMIETHVLIHTLGEFGADGAIRAGIPADLARDYARAIDAGETDNEVLRDLYHRHFSWEQERVVSDKLDEAFADFEWPFMRALCQRPWVWFSYFRIGRSVNFKQFTDRDERVEKGLLAYDRAVARGVDRLARTTTARLKFILRNQDGPSQ
ncbi:MAG: hypothetical protein MRY64_10370 [Hyphomonadaceae bacterium]|nr:hypothetical protein [Hyphomonadaceae bacterium]